MARKTGQIIRRGSETWMVRIYAGRDPETGKRRYIGKAIHGGLRAAQAHLNKMLAERDLGRNRIWVRASRELGLVRWPKVASASSAARYFIQVIQRQIAKQLVDGICTTRQLAFEVLIFSPRKSGTIFHNYKDDYDLAPKKIKQLRSGFSPP